MFFHAATSHPTPFLLPHRCKVGFMHGLLRPHQPSFCSCAILLLSLLIVYSCIIVSPLCAICIIRLLYVFHSCTFTPYSLYLLYKSCLFHASRNIFTFALNFLHASTFTPFSLICLFMHRPLCSVLFSCILFTPSSLYVCSCIFFTLCSDPFSCIGFYALIAICFFMHLFLRPRRYICSCIMLSPSLFMHPPLSFFFAHPLLATVLSVNFPSLFFSPCAILMSSFNRYFISIQGRAL